jgi:oligopeptide/dipeptide ABC transporter ATP-binding protein
MINAVNNSIDTLSIKKDSAAYTFSTSLMGAIDRYFEGIVANKKNNIRYTKEYNKAEKLKKMGRITNKVTPAIIYDIELIRSDTVKMIKNLISHFKNQINSNVDVDFSILSNEMIEHLKKDSLASVYRVTSSMARNRAVRIMKEVGIPQARQRYNQFPFQFSGGMRQRIVIAIALSANPDILICDEPTTALDVTIQAQILELINELKRERDLSVIFITHDLGVVANMADRIAVMYAGKIVEIGTVDEIFYEPAHPYTWALLASMPDLDTKEKLDAIPGTPPNMIFPPAGDAFAARNKYAMQIDFEEQPPLFEITPTHYAATWLLHPDAPKVEPPKIVTDRIKRMRNAGVAENA